MMTDSNVIKFPKENNRVNLPQSEPELYEAIMTNRTILVDEIVNRFFSQFASVLNMNGFDMEDKEFFFRYITASEMMRGILYDSVGLSHPLTDVVISNVDKAKELSNLSDEMFEDDDS